jgi:hypothetical protein
MLPLTSSPGHVLFAQSVDYYPRTDGVRNRIKEKIYLTVSNDVNEVIPNAIGPIAPLKSKLQDKIVLSYHPPFPWLLEQIISSTSLTTYLDTLKNLGITNVALIIKDWWWSGYDEGNPNVLPANNFDMGEWACNDNQRQKNGGDEVLAKIREKAHKYKYMFALHQNYVDVYSKARPGSRPLVEVNVGILSQLSW